jgi:hypothetical protein
VRHDTLRRNCVLTFGSIGGSRSAFWCIRGVKCRCAIRHALVARCGLHKKRTGTHYTKVVFLHPMGSAGHVVHYSASGAQNIDTLFFMLGWACVVLIKSAPRNVTSNMSFCIQWDPRVTYWLRCVRGVKCRCTIFHARVAPVLCP